MVRRRNMPDWSPRRGHHPDLETLAAFADGNLSRQEQELMNAHLASCEDCLDIVEGTMGVLNAALTVTEAPERPQPPPPSVPRVSRRAATIGLATLATAASLLLALWLQPMWFRLGVGSNAAV